ncbi:MAG: UDP-N-acetylmuramoyl-L-alanyl-D-glutamate--2,6-diaminopimelate ligase [Patescibacteria group bacterium]
MEKTLRIIKKIIPVKIFKTVQPVYHYLLVILGAFLYGFPAQKLFVVGVTGTKGKSTTAELISKIFEAAGYSTALLSTIHFKQGEKSERNLYKMTMPGRFFVQKFLRDALRAGATHAVIEMTSEGAKLYRHRYTEMNALVVTNLSPEHIESHGSFENYKDAKLSIARELSLSAKRPRTIVVNTDDPHSRGFLNAAEAEKKISFSRKNSAYTENSGGISVPVAGGRAESKLIGEFNVENILAATALSEAMGIPEDKIIKGIVGTQTVEGRLEHISIGQPFEVIIDYAHTPDSLEKVYKIFRKKRKICVLGASGGGRDAWKRPEMGRTAEEYCEEIILTNEDPYDEAPEKIIAEIASGIKNKNPKIIIDRREAIREGIALSRKGSVLIITGKGTDPYIMGKSGEKIPWDDRDVAREELASALEKKPPKTSPKKIGD